MNCRSAGGVLQSVVQSASKDVREINHMKDLTVPSPIFLEPFLKTCDRLKPQAATHPGAEPTWMRT